MHHARGTRQAAPAPAPLWPAPRAGHWRPPNEHRHGRHMTAAIEAREHWVTKQQLADHLQVRVGFPERFSAFCGPVCGLPDRQRAGPLARRDPAYAILNMRMAKGTRHRRASSTPTQRAVACSHGKATSQRSGVRWIFGASPCASRDWTPGSGYRRCPRARATGHSAFR
jgi:hypothetical protein